MHIYYGMATEKRSGCGDLPSGSTPLQALKMLSPRHRSPDPPRRGPPLPPPHSHHHCLLVRAAGTAGADSTAETVDGPAPGG